MTKLQEELEAESMNELEWQCQSDCETCESSSSHDETQRKNSRTSSHEDRVEMEDITSKYKVVNYVDKKTWTGTQILSR